MLAFVTKAINGIIDAWKFAASVWHDARAMQRAAAHRMGPLG